MKTFTSTLFKTDSSIWGLGFLIPPDIVQYFSASKNKRYIYIINDKKKIHRTMLPLGDGQYFLYVNIPLMKELRLKVGDSAQITMSLDESEYGMEMPEELRGALDAYPNAEQYFHSFTPGKQRTLIYLVASLKRIDSRVKKAVQIMEYLENANGKLDFRALNKWIKMSNSR